MIGLLRGLLRYGSGNCSERPSHLHVAGIRHPGGGYAYMVKRLMNARHGLNVTIRGPVKYTLGKGKFYILDEDGKEFQLVVMKKALASPPAEKAK